MASRYKAAEPLASKESDEVSRGFAKIYRHGPLKWPKLLQVDPGREFMGAVTKAMETTKLQFAAGALRFTGTKQLWSDSTAPLLNGCLGTSMLLK